MEGNSGFVALVSETINVICGVYIFIGKGSSFTKSEAA
jgi:hypothetical protein